MKSSKVFTKTDFNSGDGMLTSVWGPSLWHSLHTISFNYPVNPTKEQKKNYMNFFLSLENILPCKYCRENFKKNLKCTPLNINTMKNRHTLSLWLYKLHETINKMLGKKSGLTYNDIRNRYENFRSRCLTKKNIKLNKQSKRENGCVKPLYGKKSKCVIKIVPKETKCDTFNIDKRCIIKKKN
jgi:hypothetical protein